MIIILLVLITLVKSFKFTKPYPVNWICVLENIDVKNKNNIDQLKSIFDNIPLIIFKNQKLLNHEYYDFVKNFDDTHRSTIKKHCYDINVPDIGFRNNKIHDEHIMYNPLWHMDMIGTSNLPPVICSLYFENVPTCGGETIFTNLENAYSKINLKLKKKLENLISVYNIDIDEYKLDNNGIIKINDYDKYKETNIKKYPLIFYSNPLYKKKSILYSPFRFSHFEGMAHESSWDLLDYIFSKYIMNGDMIEIKWEINDLVIFNNRKLIHATTPTEIYKNEYRSFKTIFLETKIPIIQVNKY
jgi:alpha-ketoglutarate-dependent taurine dioxygenase